MINEESETEKYYKLKSWYSKRENERTKCKNWIQFQSHEIIIASQYRFILRGEFGGKKQRNIVLVFFYQDQIQSIVYEYFNHFRLLGIDIDVLLVSDSFF